MKRIFHTFLLATVLLSCSIGKSVTAGSGLDDSLVGYTQSHFYVNMGLYTAGSRQYVAFYDSLKVLTLAQRDLPDGPWKYESLHVANPWDTHNYVTLVRDARGILHVSGNMHVSQLQYWCTDSSGDISTIRRVDSLVGREEDRVTYPHFIPMSDGGLLFHYRYGRSGNGVEIYDRMDPEGNWTRWLDTPLTDGRDRMNAYMTEPRVVGAFYHTVWVWRDNSDCATNHDLSYARSRDLRHWEDAFGRPVSLPITSENRQLVVDPVPIHGGLLNGGATLGFDAAGRPVIAYHKYDPQDRLQIFLARPADGEWTIRQLTTWDLGWHFSGGGSIIRELWFRPVTLLPDGTLSLIYIRLDPATDRRWSKRIIIDPEDLSFIREEDCDPYPWPAHLQEADRSFSPKMEARFSTDLSGAPDWILRWESLPSNRDQPLQGPPFPPASELRVIKIQ
ncbi:MAG: BNR repeat-containing protein [Bacteroidales bacterium]|nr:BNR repeat-containing protein [Bacteroidales bacterium]